MSKLDSVKQQQLTTALFAYLDSANISVTSRGLRNLLIGYLTPNSDRETWFDGFLLEVVSLFDFLDELEDILGNHKENTANT